MSRKKFEPLDIVYIRRPDGKVVETAVERVYSVRLRQGNYVRLKLLGIEDMVPAEYVARRWVHARDHREPYPGAEGLPTLGRRHARNP